MMKASTLVEKVKDIALNYKTLYVMGCFGAPLTPANKTRYCNNHEYNRRAERTKMIQAASSDTFGFDCVNLIKGVLWGWNGDLSKVYGGAQYGTNGVPDIGADGMILKCPNGGTTKDWDKMVPGEVVWCSGHIGVYIGDGLAVESTPAFKNKTQITAVANIGSKSGYSSRKWTKHGKIPYVDYDVQVTTQTTTGGASDEKYIYDELFAFIGNAFGVCALMGSLYYESNLRSNNLQNTFENNPAKTGGVAYNDDTYTAAVDSGTYTNFANDGGGYGWAQWTYHTRKAGLLAKAKAMGKSVADHTVQMTFLKEELTKDFPAVLQALKTATDVRTASDVVVHKFEAPRDQSEAVLAKRAAKGQEYYNKYHGAAPSAPSTTTTTSSSTKLDVAKRFSKEIAGKYKVTASALHLRTGIMKTSLQIMKGGTFVQNYGYYNVADDGTKWLYVVAANGQKGYCSAAYLQKV